MTRRPTHLLILGSATVRAVTASNVLAVDREAFQALFATLPPLKSFFESLIATRTR